MLEDKLSTPQRIRLEAIAQACNAAQFKGEPSTLAQLTDDAASIATFVAGAPDTVTPQEEAGILIPKALLGNRIYITGNLRCDTPRHCTGAESQRSGLMTFDELISTLMEHYES